MEEFYKGTDTDVSRLLQEMSDAGLFRGSAHHVEHNRVIEKIDQKIPIIRHRIVQETRTLAGYVEPGVGEKRTLVSIPQIKRSNYLKVCQSIGLQNPPWPDDEDGFYWALAQVDQKWGRELEDERDRIAAIPVESRDQDCWKKDKLTELNRKIAALKEITFEEFRTANARTPEAERKITAGAKSQCRKWLADLMREGPPVKVKEQYKTEATTKWEGLSVRGFYDAWSTAIADTGTTFWSRPGRRKA
ncbi:MAG: hypothetical protein ACREVE_15485 [Gammaproteobacteria bacterium]